MSANGGALLRAFAGGTLDCPPEWTVGWDCANPCYWEPTRSGFPLVVRRP